MLELESLVELESVGEVSEIRVHTVERSPRSEIDTCRLRPDREPVLLEQCLIAMRIHSRGSGGIHQRPQGRGIRWQRRMQTARGFGVCVHCFQVEVPVELTSTADACLPVRRTADTCRSNENRARKIPARQRLPQAHRPSASSNVFASQAMSCIPS